MLPDIRISLVPSLFYYYLKFPHVSSFLGLIISQSALGSHSGAWKRSNSRSDEAQHVEAHFDDKLSDSADVIVRGLVDSAPLVVTSSEKFKTH